MIVTRNCLPRRTVLRGLSVTIALPPIDGPRWPWHPPPDSAVGAFYVPMGINMAQWTPRTEGRSK